ncbi:MAG: hypothetical protein WD207_11165, partial [Xanthobacteraceae bacterium]
RLEPTCVAAARGSGAAPNEERIMETSRFLARLVGPFLVAIGAGLLVNTDAFAAMAAEFLKSPALIFISGLLTLVAGLAIVNTHNVWVTDWRVIITIFGWLGVIGGALRIVFPQLVEQVGTAMLAQRGLLVGAWIVVLLLGLWLSYLGYLAKPARANANRRGRK